MADFVEICNVCARKVIIEAAKRIINSDKVCHSYSDLNFGVTFFGTECRAPLLTLSMHTAVLSYNHQRSSHTQLSRTQHTQLTRDAQIMQWPNNQ